MMGIICQEGHRRFVASNQGEPERCYPANLTADCYEKILKEATKLFHRAGRTSIRIAFGKSAAIAVN
jgi:dsDNA-binding SOS-regulon protein